MRMNYEETDPDNLEGSNLPLPGRYHFLIQNVEENDGEMEKSRDGEDHEKPMFVTYEVAAGKPDGQEGKTIRDKFFKSPKAFKRMAAFAVAVGLTTPDAIKAAKESGEDVEIDFTAAIGRQCCGEVIEEEWENKDKGTSGKSVRPGYAITSVWSERSEDIPKNRGVLVQALPARPEGGGEAKPVPAANNSKGKTPAKSRKEPVAAAAANDGDAYGDL